MAGLLSFDELAPQLQGECLAASVPQADYIVILTDGGNGLEEFFTKGERRSAGFWNDRRQDLEFRAESPQAVRARSRTI